MNLKKLLKLFKRENKSRSFAEPKIDISPIGHVVAYSLWGGVDLEFMYGHNSDLKSKLKTCDYCNDILAKFPNTDFLPNKRFFNFGCTYDGYHIVSHKFKCLCDSLDIKDVEFLELTRSDGFYYINPLQTYWLDEKASQIKHIGEPCPHCGGYLWTGCPNALFSINGNEIKDHFLRKTNIKFGDRFRQAPLIIIDVDTAKEFKRQNIKGIRFEPVYESFNLSFNNATQMMEYLKSLMSKDWKYSPVIDKYSDFEIQQMYNGVLTLDDDYRHFLQLFQEFENKDNTVFFYSLSDYSAKKNNNKKAYLSNCLPIIESSLIEDSFISIVLKGEDKGKIAYSYEGFDDYEIIANNFIEFLNMHKEAVLSADINHKLSNFV